MPVSYILIGFILRWSDSKKKKSWRVHILFSFSQFYKNKLISSLLCVRVLVTVSLLSSMLARFFSCKSWQDKLHFHISSYLIYFLLFFSGLKTPSKKSKGHKAGIPRWWSFRRKKHLNFLHLCWEVHLLQQENGCKLWRNLRQISPLPLQLYVFCKFFYHNVVKFFLKPFRILHP